MSKPNHARDVRHFIFQAPPGADPLKVNRMARAAVAEWMKSFVMDADSVTWFEDDGGCIRFHLIVANDRPRPASSTAEMPPTPPPTDDKGGVHE